MKRDIKLIAFDLDGVLVDGGGSWIQVHKGLGTLELSAKNSVDYYSGKITFEEWAKRDVELWKGTDEDTLKDVLFNSTLMEGIHETLPVLKKKYKVIIISGGLKMLADHLKEKFRLDAAFGNELIVKKGKIAGIKHIVDFNDKGKILKEAAARYDIMPNECAAVGDYLNDVPMFKTAGFSIAFNPKNEEVAKNATEVVYGKDLRRILKYF
jgi:phosphoserine phosphatase